MSASSLVIIYDILFYLKSLFFYPKEYSFSFNNFDLQKLVK